MNLMGMVIGFNRLDNIRPFSSSAYLLGMKLIDLLNGLYWPATVTIDANRMSILARCSKNTAINARDELIERGVLVTVSTGKKGSPSTYRMTDLSLGNVPVYGSEFEQNVGIKPECGSEMVQDAVGMRSECGSNFEQHSGTIYIQDKDHTKQDDGIEVKRKRFTPPTPEDVRAYCQEKGYAVDADRFCDFYASKGWKVGNTPMKDWRAAMRNWATRNDTRGGTQGASNRQSSIPAYGKPGDSGGGAYHLPDVIL